MIKFYSFHTHTTQKKAAKLAQLPAIPFYNKATVYCLFRNSENKKWK